MNETETGIGIETGTGTVTEETEIGTETGIATTAIGMTVDETIATIDGTTVDVRGQENEGTVTDHHRVLQELVLKHVPNQKPNLPLRQ